MASLNRNITLECSICKQKMKSDPLRRHWLAKYKSFNCQITSVVRGFHEDKDSEP